MKKLFCILLSCILVFNSVSLVYADADSTARSSFNPYEQFKKNHPDWFDSNGNYIPSGNSCLSTIIAPALIRAGETSGEIVSSLADSVVDIIKSFNNSNGDVSVSYDDKGVPVTAENYNENNFYLTYNNKFCNYFNQQMQNKVHALDGYYLYEPDYSYTFDNFCYVWNNLMGYKKDIKNYDTETLKECISAFNMFSGCFLYKPKNPSNRNYYFPEDVYFYLSGSYVTCSDGSSKVPKIHRTDFPYHVFEYSEIELDSRNYVSDLPSYLFTFDNNNAANEWCFLSKTPIKIFYSKQDLNNYLNKGRTYAPQLPSTTISIPIKYINNTTNLPDLSFNLDSLIGKAEADIQAGLDAQLKLYLDKLADININPDKPINPTPTPDGGFTDGVTPTPKPDFGDDSNPTNTNDWLKKIYEWLQSFGDTHSKFEKTITDYIEANDGKLDQIIEAINALSGGKTEDEKNGCKYDFTALSDFMTKLWNESDKKFDKMVELLEENNKYQKKLVNSLNEIKAILVTQTIMDVFQDRSQQTAEKAKDKFPTSLPWDIALVVNAMSAEPEKPQFNLPIQIKSLNINEEIHVDLASGEWEKLAKTCRYLLSILFILLMIQLSRKLFSNGGDD